MKTIELMVDLIEMGAVHPQDIVKNLRSAIAQTKPLSDEEIDKLADEYLSDYFNMQETINFVKAIEERHGIK